MEKIEINTQKEFDELPDIFGVYTLIKIFGKNIIIKRTFNNASVEAFNNASVEAWGNASVEAFNNASVEAFNNASVKAWGNASVKAWDNASVKAWDNASVKAFNNASVKAFNNASVEAFNNASVEAWGNASVEAFMNTVIRIFSNNAKILEARQQVVIVYQECEGKPTICDDTVVINKTKKAAFNIYNFVKIYNVEEIKNKLTLYKFVQADFTDFYTGKINYKIGQIIKCPDWNSDKNNECSGGLHLGATIKSCKKFNNSEDGHALKCEVDIKDIVVHPDPQYPYKVRCRKVKIVEEIFE